jgi:hypothetical protein
MLLGGADESDPSLSGEIPLLDALEGAWAGTSAQPSTVGWNGAPRPFHAGRVVCCLDEGGPSP